MLQELKATVMELEQEVKVMKASIAALTKATKKAKKSSPK